MQTFQLIALFLLCGTFLLLLARGRSASHRHDPLTVAAIGVVMGGLGVLAVFVLTEDMVPDGIEQVGTPLFIAVVTVGLIATGLRRVVGR